MAISVDQPIGVQLFIPTKVLLKFGINSEQGHCHLFVEVEGTIFWKHKQRYQHGVYIVVKECTLDQSDRTN